MTQATNTIVPMQADAVGILPYRICMSGFNGISTASSLSAGFPINYFGLTGELGIDPSAVGDVTVGGVGYVKMAVGGQIVGSAITSDTIGQGTPVTATGQKYVGFLLEPATVNGQICKILVCPGIV
jgi:hypothetical protein